MTGNRVKVLAVAGSMLMAFFSNGYGQNLSSLLDAIRDVEVKLTKLIEEERSARSAADEKLEKSIPKRNLKTTVQVKTDTTLKADIHELRGNIDTLVAAQDTLNSVIETIRLELETIRKHDGDSENDKQIRMLAESLMILIDKLKGVLADGTVTDEAAAMELGGVVTLDAGINPESVKETVVEIGDVELSAVVNVSEEIVAGITIKADNNLQNLFVDQALVEWSLKDPLTLVLGQQTYNHGLLSTHLISDPSIKDVVEKVGPGLTFLLDLAPVTVGFAGTFVPGEDMTMIRHSIDWSDSTITEEGVTETVEPDRYMGVFNVDYPFSEESMVRLSGAFTDQVLSFACGLGWVTGNLSVDGEFGGDVLGPEGQQPMGYYLGVAYGLPFDFELAVRYDGFSTDKFSNPLHRIGIGPTFSFGKDLFVSAEYSFEKDSGGNVGHGIALKGGLESTVELPGFQPRTIIKN